MSKLVWKDERRSGIESYFPTFARRIRLAIGSLRGRGRPMEEERMPASGRPELAEGRTDIEEGPLSVQKPATRPGIIDRSSREPASEYAMEALPELLRMAEEGKGDERLLAAQAVHAVVSANIGTDRIKSSIRALIGASIRTGRGLDPDRTISLDQLHRALAHNHLAQAVDEIARSDPALAHMASIYARRSTIRPPPG